MNIEETRRLPSAVAAPGHGPVVVIGGPGTGRTTLGMDLIRDRLKEGLAPEHILMLVPTRVMANRLRDELAVTTRVTFSEPVVRTFSAYAFDVIRRARQAHVIPSSTRAPRLLSGADQDRFIAEMLRVFRDGGGGPTWPEQLGDAVNTRGFRKEMREFLDRVAELGLNASEVLDYGRRCGVEEWVAGSDFLKEYRRTSALEHEEAYDPAELVSGAVSLLRGDGRFGGTQDVDPEALLDFAAAERERYRLVVVDDLQEATSSQHRLVRLLAKDKDALLTASPDTVVQGFRGARPDLVRHAGEELAWGQDALVLELEQNYRLGGALSDAVARVARRIPAATGELGRRWEPAVDQTQEAGAVDVALVESPVHRDRLISRHVLHAHLFGGVCYDDIAVIVRNGAQVRQTARSLGLDGISTTVPPVEIPLRDEAAVRPLLQILRLALQPAPATPVQRDHRTSSATASQVQSLLTGPYGRATTLDVRALRQALLILERGRGGQRNSTQLLAALMDGEFSEEALTGLGPVALPAKRLVAMLGAAREHLAAGSYTISTAIWAVWNASGAVHRDQESADQLRKHPDWRDIALNAKGLRADRANRDLDAVLALFQAAERFEDQMVGGTLHQFLVHLEEQDLPMDSLAGSASPAGRVHVLTPAATAGLDFHTVIVAGLEEGTWPTTGLRGTLLRSDDLVTVAEHGPQALPGVDVSAKLRGVREDELRQFVTAISRARHTLRLVAISSDDAAPSSFLPLVKEPHAPDPEVQDVPRASTLTQLTAVLRRAVESGADSESADAAGVLAMLATAEPPVPGASPEQWWGLAPLSSTDPIVASSVPVRVSPSKVESVLESPLNWFVQAAGGVAPTDFARSLGTLVHAIAEDHPAASQEDLLHALASRWDELEMPENWVGASERHRAEGMLERLAQYFTSVSQAGRVVGAREQPFRVELDPYAPGDHPVLLTGSMDRVEISPSGHPLIVDLKTGKVLPTKKDIGDNAQLLTYQAAVLSGALENLHLDGLTYPSEPEGASLVGVGRSAMKPTVLVQGPTDRETSPAWDMIARAARGMSADTFTTTHEQGTRVRCTHPGVCPICDEGRQVTEP